MVSDANQTGSTCFGVTLLKTLLTFYKFLPACFTDCIF